MNRSEILLITLVMLFTACSPETEKKTVIKEVVSGGDVGASGDGSGGSSGDGNGSGNGNGNGNSNITPVVNFLYREFTLAGHQNWSAADNYTDSQAAAYGQLTLREASALFNTDSRLKVRFRIFPQPVPPVGQEYCQGRVTGQPFDQYPYQKLKFQVSLRDIICEQVDSDDSSRCLRFGAGAPYRTQTIGPVDVNSYSPIIDFSQVKNPTMWGTFVEVTNVTADSACQAVPNDPKYCPAEQIVRRASCWKMGLEIATDSTQDF